MFTSRAEYRILLRQDNADLRLTPIAHRLGLRGAEERMERVNAKRDASAAIEAFFRQASVSPDEVNGYLQSVDSAPINQRIKLHNILLRPQVNIDTLAAAVPELQRFLSPYSQEFIELAEIQIKYEGYIKKEEEQVEKMSRLEDLRLNEAMDYRAITALSMEARDKLSRLRPKTIGQAGRIPGVNPADISVLLIHMGR